ncbi:MAG: hypothetical protein HY924_12080 [Elusimicrobia bacterium]|nr:hypothetical protein [Elusimicrobiota bacterium]
MSFLASLLCLCLAVGPVHAGKLDLDVYASPFTSGTAVRYGSRPVLEVWKPGDPRDLQGAGRGTRAFVHLAYVGMAAGGLAAGIATGGVAPAVGFGLVALINAWRLWGVRKESRQGLR